MTDRTLPPGTLEKSMQRNGIHPLTKYWACMVFITLIALGPRIFG